MGFLYRIGSHTSLGETGARPGVEAAEVKYRNRIDRRDLSGLRRAFRDRPVVMATKDELDLGEDYALVPAHLLLWAIG
jgi:hypothetical protein